MDGKHLLVTSPTYCATFRKCVFSALRTKAEAGATWRDISNDLTEALGSKKITGRDAADRLNRFMRIEFGEVRQMRFLCDIITRAETRQAATMQQRRWGWRSAPRGIIEWWDVDDTLRDRWRRPGELLKKQILFSATIDAEKLAVRMWALLRDMAAQQVRKETRDYICAEELPPGISLLAHDHAARTMNGLIACFEDAAPHWFDAVADTMPGCDSHTRFRHCAELFWPPDAVRASPSQWLHCYWDDPEQAEHPEQPAPPKQPARAAKAAVTATVAAYIETTLLRGGAAAPQWLRDAKEGCRNRKDQLDRKDHKDQLCRKRPAAQSRRRTTKRPRRFIEVTT